MEYKLEARARTSVTVMIDREDKTINKPWICDVDLKFANGATLFRGNIEGI